jgi:DNA-binding NtrC family response regulator
MQSNQSNYQKILILDEDQKYIELLSRGFEQFHFRIQSAEPDSYLFTAPGNFIPNFALIDMYLPTTSRIELCRNLRAFFPQLYLILMPREQTLELNMQLLKEYAYDFLVKPFKFAQAMSVINRALKDLELETKYRQQTMLIEKLKQENQYLRKSIGKKPPKSIPVPTFPTPEQARDFSLNTLSQDNA